MNVSMGVIADYASVDQHGKLTVAGIFNAFNGPEYPLVIPQCFVVFRIQVSLAECGRTFPIIVRVIDADGKPLIEMRGDAEMPPPQNREAHFMQHMIQLAPLVIPAPGDYAVSLLVAGVEQASIPLHARLVSPPQSPAGGTPAPGAA